MRLKGHSGPGARQEDKQLAVLWSVHVLHLSHICHHYEDDLCFFMRLFGLLLIFSVSDASPSFTGKCFD